MTRARIAIRHAALLLMALILAACGGSGQVSINFGTPPASALAVVINGLPSGATGDVTVSGPAGYRQRLSSSATLSGLASGTYTVVAGNVLADSMNFIPQPTTQQVTVGNGTASVTVTYGTSQPFALALQEVASGLSMPVFLTAPANDPRMFIVERAGRIRILQGGAMLATPFLDISALTTTDGERGLLSMAFDPAYAANGRFYVYYTDTAGNITIARYQVSASNANVADPAATIVLTIAHPNFSNHNGGLVAFGPDGMLYLGTGDGGGSTGDPAGNAQNLGSLLGKLLRIDVSQGQPYTIASGNPFTGQPGRRGEIWASGLRNPWRFAFDRADGTLYIADVGQDRREEIDVAAAASGGQNYGWNRLEGSACFGAPTCSPDGTTLPQLEYNHDANGGCAVVGGYVYRGNAMPALRGRYLYSDLCSGWLRSFAFRDAAAEQLDWGITIPGSVLSFGMDAQGEIYVLADPTTSAGSGKVYRIVQRTTP
ncbi:PQQ-dependent sugar dehydrogenase [Cupriavidus pinatubonensis]|uniref:PQQ-dependent sugar dehydrogenase n=1 Tax=Cupriavidus pinatubonensis TaxID=248026 RepID=UPI001C738799|nr:PQQ-dependent sugar dehydrogenase [Cupriavidus pinatubonensis]QYY30014.1 PQQ-dependent sugar dehydrogenase [Cupriavidus pinatubonensis]